MYGWTYDITYQWFKMDLRSIQREIILYSSLFCSIITSKVYQCFIIPIKQPFKPLKIHIREVHTFQDCQQNFFWDLECNLCMVLFVNFSTFYRLNMSFMLGWFKVYVTDFFVGICLSEGTVLFLFLVLPCCTTEVNSYETYWLTWKQPFVE